MMMKKIKIALLSAALLGGAVGIAAAAPGSSGRPAISAEKKAEWAAKREERMTSRFEKIDTNKDGKISRAELEAFAVKMADKRFAKMDPSNTGSVDLTQFKSFAVQARGKFARHHRHGMKKVQGAGESSK